MVQQLAQRRVGREECQVPPALLCLPLIHTFLNREVKTMDLWGAQSEKSG